MKEIYQHVAKELNADSAALMHQGSFNSEVQSLGVTNLGDRRKYMELGRITDIPPYHVPARPWTSIIDDDDVVSHLVSLFFIWNQQVFNWIDRDLFLRDMQSGRLDSRFCSPVLVNSVLAVASVCIPRNPSGRSG